MLEISGFGTPMSNRPERAAAGGVPAGQSFDIDFTWALKVRGAGGEGALRSSRSVAQPTSPPKPALRKHHADIK